ncbi:MAG: MerR family transcriptional regulator [Gaiellaceae bacterium]|jgi:DNA-binding transcriptional MerR regulator
MDTASKQSYRIGELAALVGASPRTIRYYEERGLLPAPEGHSKGQHRTYDDTDVLRLRELLRLRDLLGLPLEELGKLLEAEEARALLRDRFHAGGSGEQRRQILEQGIAHIEAQLTLVRRREQALAGLGKELAAKRQRLRAQLRALAKAEN